MYGCEVIKKSNISHADLKTVKTALSIKNPNRYNRFTHAVGPEYIQYYSEYANEILVPRNTCNVLNINCGSTISVGNEVFADIQFNKELREYQKEFFKQLTWKDYDLIFNVPAGHGKTVMTFYYLSKIKQRAIIFVNTDFLTKQWTARASEFCGENIIPINERTIDGITKKGLTSNIYCITIQFYNSRKTFIQKFIKWDFGIEIFDECHKYGADTYYPILEESIVPRRLALTATYRRSDGLHRMLEFNFGKCYMMENHLPKPFVYSFYTGIKIETVIEKSKLKNIPSLIQYLIDSDTPYLHTKRFISFRTLNMDYSHIDSKDARHISRSASLKGIAHLETIVTELRNRKSKVNKLLNECLQANRHILFLAKRKSYLKEMYDAYKDSYDCTLILGGTEVDYSLLDGKRIVFAISQLAQEALDIPHLDTEIIVHPLKDTEQTIGRISRDYPNKLQPIAFYCYDNCGVYHGLLNAAKKYMKINAEYKGNIYQPNVKNILHLHS